MFIERFFGEWRKRNPHLMGIPIETEKHALKYVEQARRLGELRADNMPYTNTNNWNVYKEKSVFLNDGTICSVEGAKKYLDAEILDYKNVKWLEN